MTPESNIGPKNYDFYLIILTSVVLAAIGLVCLYGIGCYTYNSETVFGWTQSQMYVDYIDSMNQLVYPFVVLLLVALGLCIPKRIVPRQSLPAAGTGILAVTFLILTFRTPLS